LTLLNDPTFMEASRVFAARVLDAGAVSDDEKLNVAFQRALARFPNHAEGASLRQFLALQRDHYREAADDARKLIRIGNTPAPRDRNETELAAWTQVCRVILNLHETITRF
jgi:hypothetical protein